MNLRRTELLDSRLLACVQPQDTDSFETMYNVFQPTVQHWLFRAMSRIDASAELKMTTSALGQAKGRAFKILREIWKELFGDWPFSESEGE